MPELSIVGGGRGGGEEDRRGRKELAAVLGKGLSARLLTNPARTVPVPNSWITELPWSCKCLNNTHGPRTFGAGRQQQFPTKHDNFSQPTSVYV